MCVPKTTYLFMLDNLFSLQNEWNTFYHFMINLQLLFNQYFLWENTQMLWPNPSLAIARTGPRKLDYKKSI